jgi:hypothetical protein
MGRKEQPMENQQDVFDAILGDDEDFLPDGWDGETDIITDKGELNDAAFALDGEQTESAAPEENDDGGESDADALTTGEEESDEPDQSADEETAEPAADEPVEPEVKPSRKLKLKVNHKDEEVDIDAMSDDELTVWLQKGRAFDAMKDAENKRKYRTVYQEQLDAGMTEAVAHIAAQAAADGKSYSLTDEEETPEESAPAPTHTTEQQRDFVAEVAQLRALYPDFKEVPDEVARAVAKGVPLLSAYLAYRDKQSTQTAAALKRENAVLKQNAAAAAKAPVKGVTGGGDAKPPKVDPFIQGFDEALDW